MGVGVDSCVFERIEEEIRPMAKPCTMLCELRSVDVLTSEPMCGLMLDLSLPIAVATVDVEESGTMRAVGGGDDGRGVVSSQGVGSCRGSI